MEEELKERLRRRHWDDKGCGCRRNGWDKLVKVLLGKLCGICDDRSVLVAALCSDRTSDGAEDAMFATRIEDL